MFQVCWLDIVRHIAQGGRRFVRCVAAAAMLLVVLSQAAFAALSFNGDVILNTSTAKAPALIGNLSVGSIQVDNGSTFSSGQTQVGVSPTGIGFANVIGPSSKWTMEVADVGFNGIGNLNLQNGGIIETMGPFRIGANPGAHGTVAVGGAASTLLARSQFLVGGQNGGNATLQVTDGGIVNALQSQVIIGPQGRVLLDGGLLRLNSLNNLGLISGSGEVSFLQGGPTTTQGRIEANEGDLLRFSASLSGAFENRGIIEADGGEIEFLRPINNVRFSSTNLGEISLRNGTVRISPLPISSAPQLQNSSLLVSLGGENDFYGTVMNIGVGEIAITNQSRIIFHDDVALQGGMMTVFPGSKATLLEDLSLSQGAQLLADIAGSNIETDYGEIEVVGNVTLGGTLGVVLSNGFTPEAGDSFEILKSFGGIEGSLTLGAMPALAGNLVWDLDITTNQVLLNVVPAPTGDYNRDGVVDTGDYVVWRRSVGQTSGNLAADGNGDGVVDLADHAVWSANLGATAGSGGVLAVQAAAVPEPTVFTLLLVGWIATVGRSVRREMRRPGR